MPVKDDSLVAQYIRAIENPDSAGFKNGIWYATPKGQGYDLNSRGFGMDINYNNETKALTVNRPGKWVTEEEERQLRLNHLKDNQKTLDKWTPQMLREMPSEEKKAMALGMLYRGDGIRSIIKNPSIRNAYYSGSEKDMQRAVSDFYQKKMPSRAENHNKFFNSRRHSTYNPSRFESPRFVPKYKFYDEGGYLDNTWDSLSLADKAEMIKVAVANGITTLLEIRSAYNEFAKGGSMNNWTIQDEAGYKAWRSRLPRNLRETNDNDYDMRAAYKAGMQPQWNNEDKSYHLGSRDPQSGRILKAPHHPTFLKALVEDASLGYYPVIDRQGNTYTSTWKANEFAKGGYIPSASIKKRISNWEGSSMKTNRSFEAEAKDFNRVIPEEVRSKLSPKQLDALYSYGYNVGMGNLKERVVPTLTAYTKGKASKEDVQRSMWAKRDNELKGLTTRRNTEREMFGGNYRTTFTGTGKLGTHIDPSEYTYYEDLSPMIDNISISQMQFPDNMAVDPTTLYKAPIIDETLFSKPEVIPEEAIYNPQQERIEGLKRMNTIMGLLGQSTPFAGLIDTSTPGLLSYVNQIYNS